MTVGRYLAGLAWVALALVPIAFGAVRLRARIFPGSSGPTARLVEVTLGVAAFVVVTEICGTFGAFRRWPVAAVLATVGVVAGVLLRARRPRVTVSTSDTRADPRIVAIAGLFAIAVAALWSIKTFAVLDRGPIDTDTQSYHLPHAATFVQDGWLTRIHHPTVDDAVPYHPANGELFHAAGMLAFGTDVVSPFMNLVWLAIALLAAWVLGDTWGRGALAVIGVATVLTVPVMSTTQGGSAMTDVLAVAMLIASCAFLVRADGRYSAIAVAGLAAGVALGTKLTMVVPLGVLTIALFVVARRAGYRRWRVIGLWVAAMTVAGNFWYLRNLARVGTPVPSMALGVGPLKLPKVPMFLVDRYGYSVADYVFDLAVWRRFFLPGLRAGLGWGSPVLLAVAGVVLVLLAVRSSALWVKAIAVSMALAAIGYMFTPTTALGFKGQPSLFTGNLRYLVPSLAVALALAAAVVPSDRSRWTTLFVASCAIVVVGSLFIERSGYEWRAIAFGAGLAATGVIGSRARNASPTMRRVMAGVGLLAVAVVGFFASERYVERRYAYADVPAGGRDVTAFDWAQDVSHAKIGIAGFFVNYPLYGRDLSNDVSYIGLHRADHEFTNLTSCTSWRAAVNEGRYDFVVTMPPFPRYPEPEQAAWTRTDDAVTEIRRGGGTSVFRVDARLDPSACPAKGREPTRRSDGSRRVDPGTAR